MCYGNDTIKVVQYRVILEAKQEINQLYSQYKIFGNINVDINITKLTEKYCKKFHYITKTNPTDSTITNYLKEINYAISKEYAERVDNINSNITTISNIKILRKIIRIISNPDDDLLKEEEEEVFEDENYGIFKTSASDIESLTDEEDKNDTDIIEERNREKIELIQEKINDILDKNTARLIFDAQKLREISQSKTKLSEILASLESIISNLQIKLNNNNKKPEKPHSYVLYSNKEMHISQTKPLSIIFNGNCFFVSLYGRPKTVRQVLIDLTKDEKIEKHTINDLISIYGPVDIATFSKGIENSFENLTKFSIDAPNIYFFEISNKEIDDNYRKWCNFIALISHVTIFCSKKVPTSEDIQCFNDLLFVETKTNFVFECFEYDKLDKNDIKDLIFNDLIQKVDMFIPFSTLERYFLMINEKETISSIQKIRMKLEEDKMEDYSHQILNKTREFYNEIREQKFKEHYLSTKKTKFVGNFNIDKKEIIDKVLQFFFVNTNPKFWDNKHIIDVSEVIISEIESSFISTFKYLNIIEKVGQLINLVSNDSRIFADESIDVFNQLKKLSPSDFEELKIPETSKEIEILKQHLIDKYKELIIDSFNDIIENEFLENITNELYSFLYKNPIASDEEYGRFYSELYKENLKTTDVETVKKYFGYALRYRKVVPNFIIKEFSIKFDKESFKSKNIQFESSYIIHLAPSTTCHELYELVKNNFKLEDIPFSISYSIFGKNNQFYEVEIFNNSFPLSKIKADFFTVYCSYDYTIRSTYSFIQSMIVVKEIKISNDFLIRTSSKEAEFNVSYESNHKGWFNVPFDITTPNPEKSFGEDGGVLIYLKLRSNEIDILQEGNSLVHQSYQDNEWVDELDPVFLTYPKCNTAVFLLRHCSRHRIIMVKTNLDSIIPDDKKNKKFSRDWEKYNGDIAYKRGGRRYYLPVGYQGEGILVDKFKERSCVAFHGTKAIDVSKIINNGFILPRQRGGPQKNRFQLNYTFYGVKDFANAIFVSPSIKYAARYSKKEPIIANSKKHTYIQSGHIYHRCVRIIILQVRVYPKSFKIFPSTIKVDTIGDHYDFNEMEWRISNPKKVFAYRLLTRDVTKEIYDKDYQIHCD